MAVNSSSSNDSLLHPNLPLDMVCLITRPGSSIFTTFYITNILLLLPLCSLVLYLGFQRRRSSPSAAASHSDSVTYHMVLLELVGVSGSVLCFCCIYWAHVQLFYGGFFLRVLNSYGQTVFHVLTCVERYLAVVRPVTYLRLRGERSVRIRNISIGCVWLFCIGTTAVDTARGFILIFDVCLFFFSLVIVVFCSLSVLRVLIRPGPGEQGGDGKRVDQSKQRAFYTVGAILGVLLMRCFIIMLRAALEVSNKSSGCVMMEAEVWFNIPSSLVLPLLFLHRAGTLPCCKNDTKRG